MKKLPKISIITPSLNQGEYIEETILSVISQKYDNLEYIVIDGGSTDSTLDILKKYEKHLHWISEEDRGQSHAINKGYRMATGDVVVYLNTDDIYEPGALQLVGDFFASNPGAQWVTGKCRNIDQNGNDIRKYFTLGKNFCLRFYCATTLLIMNYVSQPATFWRRELIEQIGFFNESLFYAMDYDYWLRIASHHKLWFINKYLASYRIHALSKCGGSKASDQFDEEIEVAKIHTSKKIPLTLHAIQRVLLIAIYSRLKRKAASQDKSLA